MCRDGEEMLRSAEVILFCCCNYRLYFFNPHLRRFLRHLKILPLPRRRCFAAMAGKAGLILKAEIQKSETERGGKDASHSALPTFAAFRSYGGRSDLFLRSNSSSPSFSFSFFLFLFLFLFLPLPVSVSLSASSCFCFSFCFCSCFFFHFLSNSF